ncbi:MAG: hypothetical protein IPF77_11070 [Gemmatimonadetes bacterium]|nr:hypothetical protein [Gemmatimonadota bacterium]
MPQVVSRDAAGRLLIGRPGLTVVDSAGPRRYREADGLTDPDVWALYPQGPTSGSARQTPAFTCCGGGASSTSAAGTRGSKYEVLGIAEDRTGHLWLASSYGLLRVARRDSRPRRRRRPPAGGPQLRPRGRAANHRVQRRRAEPAVPGCAGRIWLPSYAGVVRLDPARIAADTAPPQVHLERVVLDGVEQRLGPAMTRIRT